MARARGLDYAALQAAEPGFRGMPLVNIACAFRSPARFGDLLEHRLAPPAFSGGRSFGVGHTFLNDGKLVAEGEQVRFWSMSAPGSDVLTAAPVPPTVMALLRDESDMI